jgi:nucleotide-binding universal stress UspA family protein
MRYAGVPEDSIDAYRQEALQAAVLQMSEAVLSRLTFPRLTAHIVHGDAVTRLVDKERELGANLIVVPRIDKPLAEQLVFPSVTLRLLERAEADVLVVRERGTSDLTR